jgi:hypothetical protein
MSVTPQKAYGKFKRCPCRWRSRTAHWTDSLVRILPAQPRSRRCECWLFEIIANRLGDAQGLDVLQRTSRPVQPKDFVIMPTGFSRACRQFVDKDLQPRLPRGPAYYTERFYYDTANVMTMRCRLLAALVRHAVNRKVGSAEHLAGGSRLFVADMAVAQHFPSPAIRFTWDARWWRARLSSGDGVHLLLRFAPDPRRGRQLQHGRPGLRTDG